MVRVTQWPRFSHRTLSRQNEAERWRWEACVYYTPRIESLNTLSRVDRTSMGKVKSSSRVTNHVPVKPGERSSRVFSWLIYENDKLSYLYATFVWTQVVSKTFRSCIIQGWFRDGDFFRAEENQFPNLLIFKINMREDAQRKGKG